MARSYARARMLGIDLRRLRKAAGLTQLEAAERIFTTKSTISRYESAENTPRPQVVKLLLHEYGVVDQGEIKRVTQLAQHARREQWWRSYDLPARLSDLFALEADAIAIDNYEPSMISGLIQTEDYIRAIHREMSITPFSDEEIENRVEVRVRRQQRVINDQDSPQLCFVMDDTALRRPVGSSETMARQCRFLKDLADLTHVTIQVLLISKGVHPALPGCMSILKFGDQSPDIVYIDTVPGDLIISKKNEIERCRQVFNVIRSVAESPQSSSELLIAYAERYEMREGKSSRAGECGAKGD